MHTYIWDVYSTFLLRSNNNYPQGNSNPRFFREKETSLASRRWGQKKKLPSETYLVCSCFKYKMCLRCVVCPGQPLRQTIFYTVHPGCKVQGEQNGRGVFHTTLF